jgi:2,4-dienoyl-CoA reductase-like NADH-dependent reductase (Old Yellow Enzyme family)
MTISTIPKLFQPIRIGMANPQYCVVMALVARFRVRADVQHVPGVLALEYYMYKQRTSVPGTLAIAESTTIAPRTGGYARNPGIWTDEQVTAGSRFVASSLPPFSLPLGLSAQAPPLLELTYITFVPPPSLEGRIKF